jgi:putative transposase
MRDNRIYVVRTHKYKVTTDSHHHFNVAPNWLDRNFAADTPNQKWAGDISYIWTAEGWLYLTVMIDQHSRRGIGWAVSNRLKRDLALQALNRAVALRRPAQGCLHHTPSHGLHANHCRARDRGSQYCSHDYQKRLNEVCFKVSPHSGCKQTLAGQGMSGRGNYYENAAVETFFKTLKAELIWRRTWATREEVTQALFQYISGFYSSRRRHSAIRGTSPVKFERLSA